MTHPSFQAPAPAPKRPRQSAAAKRGRKAAVPIVEIDDVGAEAGGEDDEQEDNTPTLPVSSVWMWHPATSRAKSSGRCQIHTGAASVPASLRYSLLTYKLH